MRNWDEIFVKVNAKRAESQKTELKSKKNTEKFGQ